MNKKPSIDIKDKRKLISLKKKNSVKLNKNKRKPIDESFYEILSELIPKYPHIIFKNQIFNAIGVSKQTFASYCEEFDKLGLLDVPIADEIETLLSLNKSEITNQIRFDWLYDERKTSPTERIALYKLCATREELDILNDTHERELENQFTVSKPFEKNVEKELEYFTEAEILDD